MFFNISINKYIKKNNLSLNDSLISDFANNKHKNKKKIIVKIHYLVRI